MISQHIPDPDLITSYSERQDSFLAGVSPWSKFAGLILVIMTITLTRNLFICCALYGAVLLVFILARLPVKKLFGWYALPVLFVLSLVGIMAWGEPGIPLFTLPLGFFSATLTDQGVLLVLTLLVKALISVTYTLFFIMTTRYQHFSAMIYRIFPSPLDQIFLMAYRFLFLTLAMTGSMLKAVRSRGGGLIHSIKVQGTLFAEVFALVFIRSFERAERVHKAMLSRGYSGSLAALTEVPRPRPAELGFLSLFATAVFLMVWLVPNARGV
jgi:cobalt/nickel transport system permease protein